MNAPEIVLRSERDWSGVAEYTVHFAITSHLVMTTRPGDSRPFTMRATRLRLHWWWRDGEWRLSWSIFGHRYRKTTNDWSPHEKGYMHDWHIDLPDWVAPLIDANAPTTSPTAGGVR